VIYIYGESYSLNVSNSMFYNCFCSQNGGAIFFSSYNLVLRMVCAFKCSCGTSRCGQFAYLIASHINQAEYLSVSFCSNTTSGSYPIWLQSGKQRIDITNSSMNNAIQASVIIIDYPSSFTSSYCTFSNNKVSECRCLYFFSNYGTMSYANIIHNNSPSNAVVHVYGGATKMQYCLFIMNHNTLFYVDYPSLEVSHSFISHTDLIHIGHPISTTNNNSFTMKQTYKLQFFNSH